MKSFLKHIIIATITSILVSTAAFAQGNRTVTGIVRDASGEPVIAAAVFEKGTQNGVMTDMDGKYVLKVSGPQSVIVFSVLGFSDHEETVGKRTVIDVTLEEDSTMLEEAEVVAVGYGTVARRDLTGSVAKLDLDDIVKSTPQNFDQAIAGRIAGVVVTTSDGAVGSSASITIRGNNSLTQSSEPLYVIDGFPSESSMATALNPSDIESVDVLKDASATAIYGARGANGVIVITTKKGSEGKPMVTFNASWTGNVLTNRVELLDGYGFVDMMHEYYNVTSTTNDNTSIYTWGYNDDRTIKNNFRFLDEYKDAPYVDWQDLVYRNSLTQNYNVTVSGGNSKSGTRYNVSLGYLDQDGVIINSNFSRFSAKVGLNQKLAKNVEMELNANFSRSCTSGASPSSATNSGGASSYLMYSVWGYRPVRPLIYGYVDDSFINSIVDMGETNEDGTVALQIGDTRFNPVASARNEVRENHQDYFTANGAINWDILPELKLRVSGGYTSVVRRNENFDNTRTSTGYPNSWSGYGINGQYTHTRMSSWLEENILTYTKSFKDKHHLQVLGGVTFQGESSSYNGVKIIKMDREDIGLEAAENGVYQALSSGTYDWTLMSFLLRANYNFDYRYYLTFSIRADASSKFPKANRWGIFPSASVAWNFNREGNLKDARWLSNGKLRFSWGQTGNNRTSTPYDYYAQYSRDIVSGHTLDYVNNNAIAPGYYPSNMQNDDLRWETTEQLDLGLDLGFFDNRIKVTADLYLKNTYDLLLNATIPSSSGFKTQMLNIGSMRNKGLELTLDFVPVSKKNFTWMSSFNIGINRNTVTALVETQNSLLSTVSFDYNFSGQYFYITQVGRPTGLMYGYIYEGTYKEDEFINGNTLKEGIPYLSSVQRTSLRPGDPKYRDINGDGIINDNDRTIIGCGQPDFTGGFNNTFNIWRFDLNIFFNFSVGNDLLNANRLIFENPRCNTQLNQFATVKNRYTAANPDSDIPRVFAEGTYVLSSRVIEDGSFLRLKSASLGYTFSRNACKKMRMSNFRIYFSADNIWTLTNYSGQDPEVSTRPGVLTPGFDWSAYARATAFTGGISITF